MEHSLSRLEPVAERWRTATLVAAGIAALELIVILVIGVALAGKSVSTQPKRVAQARVQTTVEKARLTTSPAGVARLSRHATSVLVLNGNGRTGAASSMAGLVRARGYRIGSVGNAARSDYVRSAVMYRRGFRAEATRLARDMHIRLVGPLDGLRRRDLAGSQVALVVGR